MKRLAFLIFFLSCQLGFGQIDMDSLVHILKTSKDYKVVDTIDYLMEDFIRYQNIHDSSSYDVYFDSTGKLGSYIDLTCVYNSFDKRGRLTEITGYNLKGERRYWDFSPHTVFEYQDSLELSVLSKICGIVNNQKGIKIIGNLRIRKEFDKHRNLKSIEYEESSMDSLYFVEYWRKPDSTLSIYSGKAVFHYMRFANSNQKFATEEWFFTHNFKLDMNDYLRLDNKSIGYDSYNKYAYSKRERKNGETIYYLYNKRGKLIRKLINNNFSFSEE